MELWSCFDLPAADPRSRELSGLAWDAKRGTVWAIQDESPRIVELVPDRDLRTWSFGETIMVDLEGHLDLEGIVLRPDGFIVGSEAESRLLEIDRRGRLRRELSLPPHFLEVRTNKGLESLSASPNGRYLFTTTETALERDGATATRQSGARVRIVRLDLFGGPATEHSYETDPAPGDGCDDWGVSDLVALGDEELLVLERGWTRGRGNTVRIYRTTLEPKASSLGVERLSPVSPTLDKSLVIDLSTLAAKGLPARRQPQPTPLLDNYEGMALGPRLRDGRSSLLLVSDDNGHAYQFARLLVLSL